MVKGLSRRVVVVQMTGDRVFEQAIFILRGDAMGMDENALVREACTAAEKYVRTNTSRRIRLPAPLFAAAGAALTAAAWLVCTLV